MDNIPSSLRKTPNGFFCLSSIFSPSYILLHIQKYSMFIGSQLERQRPGFKINCAIIPISISCNSSSFSIRTETLKLQVVSQTQITCFFCTLIKIVFSFFLQSSYITTQMFKNVVIQWIQIHRGYACYQFIAEDYTNKTSKVCKNIHLSSYTRCSDG